MEASLAVSSNLYASVAIFLLASASLEINCASEEVRISGSGSNDRFNAAAPG
jgi:hypothetical protein